MCSPAHPPAVSDSVVTRLYAQSILVIFCSDIAINYPEQLTTLVVHVFRDINDEILFFSTVKCSITCLYLWLKICRNCIKSVISCGFVIECNWRLISLTEREASGRCFMVQATIRKRGEGVGGKMMLEGKGSG